jgi:hypothetical protein
MHSEKSMELGGFRTWKDSQKPHGQWRLGGTCFAGTPGPFRIVLRAQDKILESFWSLANGESCGGGVHKTRADWGPVCYSTPRIWRSP